MLLRLTRSRTVHGAVEVDDGDGTLELRALQTLARRLTRTRGRRQSVRIAVEVLHESLGAGRTSFALERRRGLMTLTVCLGDSRSEPLPVASADLHVSCAPIHHRKRLVAILGFARPHEVGPEARYVLLLETIAEMVQLYVPNAKRGDQDKGACDRL